MKAKFNAMLSSLAVAIVGLILVMYPGSALEISVRILGIGLLLTGAVSLIISLLQKDKDRSVILPILYAVIDIVLGLFILLKPGYVVASFPIIAGLVMLFEGVTYLLSALRMKKGGHAIWKLSLCLGVALVILGIVFFANPFHTMAVMVSVLGVSLIVTGVAGTIIALRS